MDAAKQNAIVVLSAVSTSCGAVVLFVVIMMFVVITKFQKSNRTFQHQTLTEIRTLRRDSSTQLLKKAKPENDKAENKNFISNDLNRPRLDSTQANVVRGAKPDELVRSQSDDNIASSSIYYSTQHSDTNQLGDIQLEGQPLENNKKPVGGQGNSNNNNARLTVRKCTPIGYETLKVPQLKASSALKDKSIKRSASTTRVAFSPSTEKIKETPSDTEPPQTEGNLKPPKNTDGINSSRLTPTTYLSVDSLTINKSPSPTVVTAFETEEERKAGIIAAKQCRIKKIEEQLVQVENVISLISRHSITWLTDPNLTRSETKLLRDFLSEIPASLLVKAGYYPAIKDNFTVDEDMMSVATRKRTLKVMFDIPKSIMTRFGYNPVVSGQKNHSQ